MSNQLKSPYERKSVLAIAVSRFGRIGVLMGGPSSEREISLKSGKAIYQALQECGCQVSPIDIPSADPDEIASLIREAAIQVAFIALHGRLGEDGTIQKILEDLNIPYIGSGVKASQIAINKVLTQELLKKNKIPVPPFIPLHKKDSAAFDKIWNQFQGSKLVIKPAQEGSSIGISLVENKEDLGRALKTAFEYGDEVLIERFVTGREFTVGILDEKVLPVIEIKPKNRFFDFNAKYEAGTTEYIVPAVLPPKTSARLQQIALKTHQVIGCRHFSRVDVMMDEGQNPFVLEVNTIPGFTSMSLLPKAAGVAGLDFTQLCLKLLTLAYAKK